MLLACTLSHFPTNNSVTHLIRFIRFFACFKKKNFTFRLKRNPLKSHLVVSSEILKNRIIHKPFTLWGRFLKLFWKYNYFSNCKTSFSMNHSSIITFILRVFVALLSLDLLLQFWPPSYTYLCSTSFSYTHPLIINSYFYFFPSLFN